ncbi:MAG: hypothetical protein AAF694_07800 [Bacteroidota bacterium]
MKIRKLFFSLSLLFFVIAIAFTAIEEPIAYLKLGFFALADLCFIIGFVMLASTELMKKS